MVRPVSCPDTCCIRLHFIYTTVIFFFGIRSFIYIFAFEFLFLFDFAVMKCILCIRRPILARIQCNNSTGVRDFGIRFFIIFICVSFFEWILWKLWFEYDSYWFLIWNNNLCIIHYFQDKKIRINFVLWFTIICNTKDTNILLKENM